MIIISVIASQLCRIAKRDTVCPIGNSIKFNVRPLCRTVMCRNDKIYFQLKGGLSKIISNWAILNKRVILRHFYQLLLKDTIERNIRNRKIFQKKNIPPLNPPFNFLTFPFFSLFFHFPLLLELPPKKTETITFSIILKIISFQCD